jgi:hypothetical protein
MTVRERDGGPVVVSMPAEIDLANAGRAGEQFCDSAGIRTLLRARDDVAASHAQLRLAVARSGAVRRALQAIGVQYVLPVYPTVAAALAPDVPSSRSAQ